MFLVFGVVIGVMSLVGCVFLKLCYEMFGVVEGVYGGKEMEYIFVLEIEKLLLKFLDKFFKVILVMVLDYLFLIWYVYSGDVFI